MVLIQNYRHIEMQPLIFINYIDTLVIEECKNLKLDVPTPLGRDFLINKLLTRITDVQIYFIFISEDTNNDEVLSL